MPTSITIHREDKDKNGNRNFEESTVFAECIGIQCPFYRKIKDRDMYNSWLVREQCKRANNEKR